MHSSWGVHLPRRVNRNIVEVTTNLLVQPSVCSSFQIRQSSERARILRARLSGRLRERQVHRPGRLPVRAEPRPQRKQRMRARVPAGLRERRVRGARCLRLQARLLRGREQKVRPDVLPGLREREMRRAGHLRVQPGLRSGRQRQLRARLSPGLRERRMRCAGSVRLRRGLLARPERRLRREAGRGRAAVEDGLSLGLRPERALRRPQPVHLRPGLQAGPGHQEVRPVLQLFQLQERVRRPRPLRGARHVRVRLRDGRGSRDGQVPGAEEPDGEPDGSAAVPARLRAERRLRRPRSLRVQRGIRARFQHRQMRPLGGRAFLRASVPERRVHRLEPMHVQARLRFQPLGRDEDEMRASVLRRLSQWRVYRTQSVHLQPWLYKREWSQGQAKMRSRLLS